MSVAAETREAVRTRPFLYDALRAGVVNYTAAARHLDVGDPEAVAAALRRFAEELPAYEPPAGSARVSMQSGLGKVAREEETDSNEEPLFALGDVAFVPEAGSLTGVIASGEVSPAALATVLGRLSATDVTAEAAGVAGDALLVVVPRRDGPRAVEGVEGVLG